MAVKPPLTLMTTTLWEYPSQDYGREVHGDKDYAGATPAWVIWQLLQRYTREGDVVLDPMCGSGTTLDVAKELGRKGVGFDLASWKVRKDIEQADARHLPLKNESVDFVFVDPPYSTHVEYSDDPRCIGKLDAGEGAEKDERRKTKDERRGGGMIGGLRRAQSSRTPIPPNAYYEAIGLVIAEMHRVLRNRRYMGLYVCDSFRKGKPFMPIGFELFAILRRYFKPADIIAVVRHNRTMQRGHWHAAAVEGNFFLRGFNYLFIMKKEERQAGG